MSEPDPRQPSLPPIEPGTVLAGKYRVERVIGRGGMGVVVEARHIALEERVALKFLLAEHVTQRDSAARFLREARAAVKIKSEHVARVSDVGTLDNGAPYMVMEFLVGEDLSNVLQSRGPLSLQDAVDYLIQGCEAIAEAHVHGIVHRDLKPSNLFLTGRADRSPLVKVLDFGISKVVSGGRVDDLTRTAAAMGSALYMSPEQMHETRSVDHRTDIYALGVTLYELLAGRPPFYAETLPALCAEVLTGTPTPLLAFRPELPAAFAAALARAYARDRNERYASIAEFVLALAPFAPSRSHPLVERIARMGGFSPPFAEDSGAYRAVSPPLQQPASGFTPIPRSPLGTPATPEPSRALDPRAAQQRQPFLPVITRIIPEPYRAPSSARAAATFASSRITGFNLYAGGRGSRSSSPLAIAVMVAGALVLGVLAGVIALRQLAGGIASPPPSVESPAAVQPPSSEPPPPAITAASTPPPEAPIAAPEVLPASDPTTSVKTPAPSPPRQGAGNHAPAPYPAPKPSKPVDLNDPN